MKFETIVSLGGDCATRYHIDRALKVFDPSFTTETFFFDWLCRNRGFESNLIALRNNLNFEKKNDFELRQVEHDFGSYQVYHHRTGFYFLHEFSFTNNTLDTKNLVQNEFEEQFEKFILKLEYLSKKTLALMSSEKNILFVFAKQAISQEQINEFFSMVSNNS